MDIGFVKEMAGKAREVFKDNGAELFPVAISEFPRGHCGVASDFLAQWMANKGVTNIEYVCGSRGDQTHGWLEIKGYIIDITADQFIDFNQKVYVETDRSFHDTFENQKRSIPIIHSSQAYSAGRFTKFMCNY